MASSELSQAFDTAGFFPGGQWPGGQFFHFPRRSVSLYIDQTRFTVLLVLQEKASQLPPDPEIALRQGKGPPNTALP